MNKIDYIPACISIGQKKSGTELAATEIINSQSFQETLKQSGHEFEILEDIEENAHLMGQKGAKEAQIISQFCDRLAHQISTSLKQGHLPLTLGGDHSCGLGTIAGSLKHNAQTRVIWFDAHPDLNTPSTSLSGNFHGMPLSFLLGIVQQAEYKELFQWVPKLASDQLCFIGIRDIDPAEKEFIDKYNILYFGPSDIAQMGMQEVMSIVFNRLDPYNQHPFHLSFDIDGLDASLVPSTGTPVEKGVDLIVAKKMISLLTKNRKIQAMDIVEFNPLLGDYFQRSKTLHCINEIHTCFIEELKKKEQAHYPCWPNHNRDNELFKSN